MYFKYAPIYTIKLGTGCWNWHMFIFLKNQVFIVKLAIDWSGALTYTQLSNKKDTVLKTMEMDVFT